MSQHSTSSHEGPVSDADSLALSEQERVFGAPVGPCSNYRLDARAATGDSSEVWFARHVETDHRVVLKVYHHRGDAQTVHTRADHELSVLKRCAGPGVPGSHGVTSCGDDIALVLESIDGLTLEERCRREGSLSPPVALELLVQLASALHRVHERGLVHSTLCPSHVIVHTTTSDRPRLVIVGFGSAVAYDVPLTTQGMDGISDGLLPERTHELSRCITPASDVYELGCLLHFMVRGYAPYTFEGSALSWATRPIPYFHRSDVVDDGLRSVCNSILSRTMARDPRDRIAARELVP